MNRKPSYEELAIKVKTLEAALHGKKEIEDREPPFKFLTENMADLVWTTDLNFKFNYSSPSVEKVLGYTSTEWRNQTIEEIITPDSVARAVEMLSYEMGRDGEEGVDPNRSAKIDSENYTKDGRTRWFENHVTFLRDANAKIIGIMGAARDITDRKWAETALRESERRFRDLAELLPETIFENDLEGRFLFVNQKASVQYGYTPEEFATDLVGLDLIHPSDRRRVMDNFKKVLNDEHLGLNEYLALRKDGSTFPALYQASPIRHGGKMVGVRGFIINISEKKAMESRLKASQKMESIGTLAGGVAHEFNNFIGIIMGNAEMAMDDLADSSSARMFLKEIVTASLRAKEAVQQILRFVCKMPSAKNPIQVGKVIHDALPLIRATLPKSVQLHQQIRCESEMIMANAAEIHQSLLNLCANAVHAMAAGGGQLTIELAPILLGDGAAAQYEGLGSGHHAKLTVKDTGSGIDPNIMDRIFEPYFTTKSVDEGLGMGLAVVYGIVKHFEGAIKISSRMDEGTTVDVLFPLTVARAETTSEKEPMAPGAK